MLANSIGFRANATAIAVPSSRSSVLAAASASGRKGSWLVSAVHTPSYPAASWALALDAISSVSGAEYEPAVDFHRLIMAGVEDSGPSEPAADAFGLRMCRASLWTSRRLPMREQ